MYFVYFYEYFDPKYKIPSTCCSRPFLSLNGYSGEATHWIMPSIVHQILYKSSFITIKNTYYWPLHFLYIELLTANVFNDTQRSAQPTVNGKLTSFNLLGSAQLVTVSMIGQILWWSECHDRNLGRVPRTHVKLTSI